MNGKRVLISAMLVVMLSLPAFGAGGGVMIMAVNLDRLGPGAVLDTDALVEIAALRDDVDTELVPIRGILTSDERMCLLVYDPAKIMFDDYLVSLETETSSDDISFISVGDYSEGVPAFDMAVVRDDGTVMKYRKDAFAEELLTLEDGTILLAFVTMNETDVDEASVCQEPGAYDQSVVFELNSELAHNRSMIAFLS